MNKQLYPQAADQILEIFEEFGFYTDYPFDEVKLKQKIVEVVQEYVKDNKDSLNLIVGGDNSYEQFFTDTSTNTTFDGDQVEDILPKIKDLQSEVDPSVTNNDLDKALLKHCRGSDRNELKPDKNIEVPPYEVRDGGDCNHDFWWKTTKTEKKSYD